MLSAFTRAVWIPSTEVQIKQIFKTIEISRNASFMDLGSGDGRTVLYVAKHFGCNACGVDVNPLLVAWARLRAQSLRLPNATFRLQNLLNADIGAADFIYVFLLPGILEQFRKKCEAELKPDAVVIAHGFKIKTWDRFLARMIEGKPFKTYIYKYTPARARIPA